MMMFLEEEIVPYRILENQKKIMHALAAMNPGTHIQTFLDEAHHKTCQLTKVLYPMVKYSEEKLGELK